MSTTLSAARFMPEVQPSLAELYARVRSQTETLAEPLSPEDQTIQSMPDASPTKWHRAHTTWFFETFVLEPFVPGYSKFDPAYGFLFNSYYEAVGPRHPRPRRGLVSRPGMQEIAAYRAHVDAAMAQLLQNCPVEAIERVVLGLQHEQQHQELLITDIKHALHCNPTMPAYFSGRDTSPPPRIGPMQWATVRGGICRVGHTPTGEPLDFAFDNETPAHDVLLRDFRIADRPVSNGEFLEFIEDGGYKRPELWLSDGWSLVQQHQWDAPEYWHQRGGKWHVYSLHGLAPMRPDEPVCHVSWFEAAAFAQWTRCRLPTEFEWEVAARRLGLTPEVWEWTASPYTPYPGYHAPSGALGEYNGKFMINQMVLRGASYATPPGHGRVTYRNFFAPAARWQFSGIRLAT